MVICMNNSAFIKNGILKSFLFASTLLLVTPVMAQATFSNLADLSKNRSQ